MLERRRGSALSRRTIGASALGAIITACGFSGVALGPAQTTDDGGRDGAGDAIPDSATYDVSDSADGVAEDAALFDGGAFMCGAAEVSSCLSCDAGIYACNATGRCVADCKTCAGSPIQCIACAPDAGAASARCEPMSDGGACISGAFVRCPCTTPIECPGARQVCAPSGCAGCGEDGSDGLTCKGPPLNKHCDSDGTGNPLDEVTCR